MNYAVSDILGTAPVPPYKSTTGQAPVCHRGMFLSRDPEVFGYTRLK